jgi:rhamnopyranosyl-N-acetylglucosaminyl-diphospho-decaprenol beta-1,3/1,4-galactofuranosyltransferase
MKIAAVVVTHNRLPLLKQCINHLLNQSRSLDGIFVIDNGSTDGTSEWAKSIPQIVYILQENVGGAGGFSRGLAEAFFDEKFDWVWCMDDDCVPSWRALEALVFVADRIGKKYPVLNSNVCRNETGHMSQRDVSEVSVSTGEFVLNGASFFNGTLISRRAYSEIGNVNKDLIIWGDEINYFMRCRNRYKHIPVAVASCITHPPTQELNDVADWKKYFMVRNSFYNAMRYSRFGPVVGLIWVSYLRAVDLLKGRIKVGIIGRGAMAGILGHIGSYNPYREPK